MTDPDSCAALVKAGNPPSKSEPCLRRAVRHICHDLYLLQEAWESRTSHVGYTMWFITVRALMDFFFRYERRRHSDGSYDDDILAADYLAEGRWRESAEALERSKPSDYDYVRIAANKLAAHLTYSRVDAEGISSPPSPAVHEFILRVATVWLEQLQPQRRAWFGRGFPSDQRAV